MRKVYWVLLVVAIAFVSMQIGKWDRNNELGDYRQQVELYKAKVDSVLSESNRLDSLATIAIHETDSLEIENKKLKDRERIIISDRNHQAKMADSLKVIVDTLSNVPAEAREYIVVLEQKDSTNTELIQVKDGIIFNLEGQVRLTTIRGDLQTTRADSLEAILRQAPLDVPDPDHVWGFIPKPSRKTAFLGGVAVGVGTILFITK